MVTQSQMLKQKIGVEGVVTGYLSVLTGQETESRENSGGQGKIPLSRMFHNALYHESIEGLGQNSHDWNVSGNDIKDTP